MISLHHLAYVIINIEKSKYWYQVEKKKEITCKKFQLHYISNLGDSNRQTVQRYPFSQNVFTVLIIKSLQGLKPSKHQLNHPINHGKYARLQGCTIQFFQVLITFTGITKETA